MFLRIMWHGYCHFAMKLSKQTLYSTIDRQIAKNQTLSQTSLSFFLSKNITFIDSSYENEQKA